MEISKTYLGNVSLYAGLFCILLNACSVTSSLHPYHIDIRQGNYITQEQVDRLKPGLTRTQVRLILGTPLVSDMFHANRWDYIYRYSQGGNLAIEKHFSVFFEGDQFSRFEGEAMPANIKLENTKPAAPPATEVSTQALPAEASLISTDLTQPQ